MKYGGAQPWPVVCPISGQPAPLAFNALVLGRHTVRYHYCESSGFLRTEPPYWLADAYTSAIASTDTGLVQRNLSNALALETLIERLGLAGGRILDVAGGYGLLTRLLRDRGFDAYSTDAYCENLFAMHHQPPTNFRADLLLAFEVLEHVEDGLAFLKDLFLRYGCRTLVFSTTTFEGVVPTPEWWYYAFETGQHISFYQPRTLQMLANRLGVRYLRLRSGLHLFTDRHLPPRFDWAERSGLLARWIAWRVRSRRRDLGLTLRDHEAAKAELARQVVATTAS